MMDSPRARETLMVASSRLFRVLAATSLILMPLPAQAQLEGLRKARDILKDRLPTVDALFGRESPITTSLDDARDGVPSMDGFSPDAYSPTYEMPVAQDGTILLVPGAYAMQVKSYCLKPGTYGPQRGDGYLHTQWEGPKADLISDVIVRATAHPEIPQYHVQMLLWGILARTKMNNLQNEAHSAALRLLTPKELLDLSGYGLSVVPNALRDRVLAKVPGTARRVFEAENDMRRLLGSADAKYADMERVAVLSGRMPESEQTMLIPHGRWSYHPAGVFVRYDVMHYSRSRMDIYYPDSVSIRRDGTGRIISVASSDGRRLELNRASVSLASFRPVNRGASAYSRLAALDGAMRNNRGDATRDLLELARVDYEDLLAIQGDVKGTAQDRHLIQNAVHSALARLYGIARHESPIARGSALEASLRPVRTTDGFAYVIAPVAANMQHPGRMMPLQPGGGGGTGPNQRQRAGMSPPPPMFLAGGNQPLPGEPDALDKAKNITDKMQAASDILGAATDPAGAIGGKAPFSPGSMFSAGLDAAFGAARSIGNSLGGGGGFLPPLETGRRVARMNEHVRTPFIPVSLTNRWIDVTRKNLDEENQSGYRAYARPKAIDFPKVTPRGGVSPAHAEALNSIVASTMKLATTLDAWAATRRRFVEAVNAGDMDWQYNQGLAIVHLKRAAGLHMLKLANDIAVLKQVAPPGPLLTAADLAEGQRQLQASGFPAATLAVATQLGRTGADMESLRRRSLSQSPESMVSRFPGALEELQTALKEYGTHLTRLPSVAAPWELPGQ